jgi:LysR family nitrogen assimilation transcriptional regulator
MTLRQLEVFSAIVETGRFTAAARKLYLAQPSVSQQIHALEEELGDRLFVRLKNRRVELTEAGKIFKEHSDLVLRQCELARMEVSALSREPSGQIRL